MIVPTGYKWSAALLMIVISIATAAAIGLKTGKTLKQAEWDASVLARKAGEDAALKAAAAAIAKIEVKSETYIQPLKTELRTNTVYRDCQHTDDSLRNLNALITGTEPADYSVVPKAKSTR